MNREEAKEICEIIETHGIEVIKAYGEGKTIQHLNLDGEWVDCDMPISFVNNHSFRVKPGENYTIKQNAGENQIEGGVVSISGSVEKHYRPFKDCDELIEYWYDFTGVINCSHKLFMPTIWVREKDTERDSLIVEYAPYGVTLGGELNRIGLQELFDNYTFLDGTPCGITE